MTAKLLLTIALLSLATACVPVAIGAGGAIIADQVAEDQGSNLF